MNDSSVQTRAPTLSPSFLLPFAAASWCFAFLGVAEVMHGLPAAIVSSIVALLVGCALCVREDESALFSVAAGLWAVAGAFFAMPFLIGDRGAFFGAWIAASDLSFCASVATDRLIKDLGFGTAGRLASSAIAAHGILLAIVYVYGGTWGVPLYTLFIVVHTYSIQKRLTLLQG